MALIAIINEGSGGNVGVGLVAAREFASCHLSLAKLLV